MKQNNQNTNTPIMLDSKNTSNLIRYEAHIKLMYQYAIATLMLMLIVCLLTGCEMRQFIYPDSKEFARICNETREKGFAGILYDEKLQPNSEQNFDYLYRLYGNVEMGRKDYMLGRDRERLSKPLYTPSVTKNTSNALNTDTLNTKQKSPFYFLCILLCILFSLLHKITSKITHILKILTL